MGRTWHSALGVENGQRGKEVTNCTITPIMISLKTELHQYVFISLRFQLSHWGLHIQISMFLRSYSLFPCGKEVKPYDTVAFSNENASVEPGPKTISSNTKQFHPSVIILGVNHFPQKIVLVVQGHEVLFVSVKDFRGR